MAKKKKFGAILEKQTKQIPVVKQKAPKTISTNVSTGGMRSAVSSTTQSVAKSARQKAEEDRSARMRQGLSKTFSAVVRSGFNQRMSQPTRVKKGMFQSLGNALQPVKKNASSMANTRSTGAPIGQIKSSILAPVKQDIKDNPYDAVRKVGMKGSRNERKVYVPMWQRDENGQISSNQRRLENAARGGNRKAGVEAALARTKAQTLSGHTYDQYVNAELNKKGLLGQDYILRGKDPSQEAIDYRNRYGFDEEALNQIKAIADNAPASGDYNERFNGQDNGSVLDRIKFGLDESWRARGIEDTYQRMYGKSIDDDTQAKLDAVRDSGGYMVGNMLGQASQFALTAPLSGAIEGRLLSKVGLEGGRAAIKTTGDALKYAGARIGADQIVSAPVNILDALKADNGEEFVKRLGLNTAMDVFFGGLTEIPGLRKNIHFVRGLEMNNAANATSDASQKLVAKVGAQRELRQAVEEAGDAARLEAIQNANGISASTMNGADALDMVDDDALRSIENMGYGSDAAREADIPNVSAPAESTPRRYTPQNAEQSARIQNALNTIDQYGGLDRMLRTADDTDRLIRTFQDPAFNDVDMLEGVANNLFPEGKMRSIRIDAERAYSNDVRAFDADPESFDFIQPVREDYYIDLLSKEVVDELQRSRNVRDIIPQLADDLGVSEEELLDALRRTEGEFYGYAPSEGVRNARTVVENAPAQNFDAIADARDVYQNAVRYYDDLIADLEARGDISNETLQWLRARRNATDKARLKAGKNLKSADEYVDRFAKDIDYVRDRIYKTDGYDIFERHSVGKANEEIRSALSEMNERLTPINGRRQPAQMVTKESANVVPNERTVRRPNRQIKEGDVSSSLLRNLGYDGVDEVAGAADNAAREATQQTARAAEKSAEVPKAKSQVEKPKSITTRSELEAETLKPNHKEIEQKYNDLIKKVEDDFYDVDYLEKYVKDNSLYVDNNAMKPRKDRLKSSVIGNLQRKKRDDVLIPLKDRTTDSLEREERFLTYDNYAAYSDSDQYRLGKVRDELRKREPKTEKTRAKSSSAWDDIPNVAKADEEPQDLVRANPHRKENTIPKASDQKTRKEVLFRGETADRNGARETAEQVAEAPKKRNQVKGILGEEKAEKSAVEKQADWDEFDVKEAERRSRELTNKEKKAAEKHGTHPYGEPKVIDGEETSKAGDTLLSRDDSIVHEDVQLRGMEGVTNEGAGRKTTQKFNASLESAHERYKSDPRAFKERLKNARESVRNGKFPEGYDNPQDFISDEAELQKQFTRRLNAMEEGSDEYWDLVDEAWEYAQDAIAGGSQAGGYLRQYQAFIDAHPGVKAASIDKTLKRLYRQNEKRLKKIGIDEDTFIKNALPKEMRTAILTAETKEEASKAWAKASIHVWNQIPASIKEKVDFLRINAMLLNPKTHIRNIFGNALFVPMRELKNLTGTGLEYIAQKAGVLDKAARTKAVIPDKAAMKIAKDVRKNNPAIRGASRLLENLANGRPLESGMTFMAGRQNANAVINGVRKFLDKTGNANAWLLEHEDFIFFNGAFDRQFGRITKARGLTADDLLNNPKLLDDVTEAATEEALRATYRDESAAARVISKWKNPPKNASAARKAAGLALDAVLPFTKTPINILRRAIDYSPAGAGKGIYHLARGIHDGNQKMIVRGLDQLSSAIPGTGLAMLGWFMSENDGVTAKLGSDKDDQFMKDLGKQNFSIVFNAGTDKEWSYTLDWAAPGCIPFFTGVAFKEMSDEGVDFWEAADAFEQMLEPMTEMSVMQGIKNTLETFQRESGGGVMQGLTSVGINTGLSYVGQFKPTLVSQAARTIDPVRRDTTSTAESASKRQIERWWNKQKAGIPGLSKTLNPYQNVWGETENNTYNDDLPMRIVENFFSPGYAKKYKADDVDKEIIKLYQQDPSADGVIPTKFSKYEIGFDGGTVRFSTDDRSNFIKVQGKVSKQDLHKLFDSQEYKNASLTDKQKMIANVYSDAKGQAKRDTLLKMGKDEWKVYTDDFDTGSRKKDYSDAKAAGLKADQYYELMTNKDWDLDENGSPMKSELALYLNANDNLTDEQRSVIFSKLASGNTKNPYEDGTAHTTDWQAEYNKKKNKDKDSSKSKSKSKKGRSGRRSGGGGGSSKTKARAKTASEKRFAALQKMKAPTTGKGIEALSHGAKGLTKAQKKALIKLLQKKLEV